MIGAIAAGIVACVGLELAFARFGEYVMECCTGPESILPLWYVLVSAPLSALVQLAPGFITAWLAPRWGILVGAITGVLGHAAYGAMFLTFWQQIVPDGTGAVIQMILQLLFMATSWGMYGAAAGGTAQLIRSRKRV